jgi:hypothetical protein
VEILDYRGDALSTGVEADAGAATYTPPTMVIDPALSVTSMASMGMSSRPSACDSISEPKKRNPG